MGLTRDFKETLQARAQRDPAFREGLLKEGLECLLASIDVTGKQALRDYINATIGFEEFGAAWRRELSIWCRRRLAFGLTAPHILWPSEPERWLY